MARNRMIKPEFWEDDKIGECSPIARLLFIALWNFADDEGYLEHRTKWIKAKCFPYDEIDVELLINELLKVGCLEKRGEILFVKNFLKHQKIERPKPSTLSQIFKDSPMDRRQLPDESPTKREEKLSKIEVKLSEVNFSPKGEVAVEPQKNHSNENINMILAALQQRIGIDTFADSQKWQRIYGKHLYDLFEKLGKEEFLRRLDILRSDSFKSKRLNEIRFVYEQLKGFIEPKASSIAIIS